MPLLSRVVPATKSRLGIRPAYTRPRRQNPASRPLGGIRPRGASVDALPHGAHHPGAASRRGSRRGVSASLPRIPKAGLLCLAIAASSLASCSRNDLFNGANLIQEPPPPPPPPDCPPPPLPSALKVKINELMVLNEAAFPDERGQFVPWCELFNPTDAEMNLGGIPLTDDLLVPDKWKIPCVPEAKVPPQGFLVVFLDGDTESDDDFHASFTIQPGFLQLAVNGGSDILFYDASGLGADQSSGRFPDGDAAFRPLGEPTPGAPNKDAAGLSPEGKFLRGDANGDGRVNVTDMNAVLRVLFRGEPPPECMDRLDSNDDGLVNLTDATFIGDTLFQPQRTFPPPYPSPGTDPTPDSLPCPQD